MRAKVVGEAHTPVVRPFGKSITLLEVTSAAVGEPSNERVVHQLPLALSFLFVVGVPVCTFDCTPPGQALEKVVLPEEVPFVFWSIRMPIEDFARAAVSCYLGVRELVLPLQLDRHCAAAGIIRVQQQVCGLLPDLLTVLEDASHQQHDLWDLVLDDSTPLFSLVDDNPPLTKNQSHTGSFLKNLCKKESTEVEHEARTRDFHETSQTATHHTVT